MNGIVNNIQVNIKEMISRITDEADNIDDIFRLAKKRFDYQVKVKGWKIKKDNKMVIIQTNTGTTYKIEEVK